METATLERIRALKQKYEKWELSQFLVKDVLKEAGIYFIAEDKDRFLYIAPNGGQTVAVYSKEGQFQETLSFGEEEKENPRKLFAILCIPEKQELLLTDIANSGVYGFSLDKRAITKKYLAKSIKNHSQLFLALSYLGDGRIGVLSRDVSENFLSDTLRCFALDSDLQFQEELISFRFEKIFSRKTHDLAFEANSKKLYLLYGSRFISLIEGGEQKIIFDGMSHGCQLTSICCQNNAIYATVAYNLHTKMIKLSLEGEFIYQFDYPEIHMPTCVRPVEGGLAIVSRMNSQIVFLKQSEVLK